MTPSEFRAARLSLGLTASAIACLYRVSSDSTVQHWKAGARAVPGPVAILTKLLLESADVRKQLGLAAVEP